MQVCLSNFQTMFTVACNPNIFSCRVCISQYVITKFFYFLTCGLFVFLSRSGAYIIHNVLYIFYTIYYVYMYIGVVNPVYLVSPLLGQFLLQGKLLNNAD